MVVESECSKQLIFSSLTGGAEKGPATNFFRTLSAEVSVKTAPWRWTEVALATQMQGSGTSWQASVPEHISEHVSFALTS